MYYIAMLVVGIIVMYVPFGISWANSKSTPGLRFLCAGICTLNASLMTLCIMTDTPSLVNVLLYIMFILFSMDVALRKNTQTVDIDA